ncbi:MAG: alpha/beta fold hydrolase [Acidimicrobiia bacterium]
MPFATVNETTLYYREAGGGPLALFVHGFPLDHRIWLDQLGGLAHVRRCVAVDLRGFGRSDPVTEAVLTMEVFADDLVTLVEQLGEQRADVIGLSMGGYVALALWEARPELVRTISLVDTRAAADTAAGRAARDDLTNKLLDAGREGLSADLVGSLLGAEPTQIARARLRSMIEESRYETLVAALEGMKQRADRTALLASIDVPALVVVGKEDALIPLDQAQAMAEAIPGARMLVVPGAGHLPPMERPDQVNSALMELFEGRKVVWWR